MPLKLLVTSGDLHAPPEVYTFDRPAVTIGRDPSVDLVLTDTTRVLSKRHAEVRREGGSLYVVDLGSKNGTQYGGRRLPSEQPMPVHDGDTFSVGDYRIEVRFEPDVAPDLERTVFAADFANPFAEPAELLAGALDALRRGYELAGEGYREDALREALEDALPLGPGEAGRIVAAFLGGRDSQGTEDFRPSPTLGGPERPVPTPPAAAPPASAAPLPVMPPVPSLSEVLRRPPSPPQEPSGVPPWTPPQRPADDAEDDTSVRPAFVPAGMARGPGAQTSGRVDALLDRLLRGVSRLVGIPPKFKYEFIGQTVVETDANALRDREPAELKQHFLDPRLDPDEAERRLTALDEAVEAVVVHQVALLDGYRASAQDGARRLLEALDPSAAEAAAQAEKGVFNKLPMVQQAAVLERLKEIHRDLGSEDWAAAERRAFRPAFIKAYLARMSRANSPRIDF